MLATEVSVKSSFWIHTAVSMALVVDKSPYSDWAILIVIFPRPPPFVKKLTEQYNIN